jgi:hypothetical protein
LSAGWNLISFPAGELTDLTVPTGVQTVFRVWDSASQAYQQVPATVAGVNAGEGTGRGFWAFSESSASMPFQGLQTQAQTVALATGWNLIGLPRTDTVTTDQLTITDSANHNEGFLSDVGCDDLVARAECLLFEYLFGWSGSYAALNASEKPGLQAKRGYWLYAWKPLKLDYFPLSTTDLEGP